LTVNILFNGSYYATADKVSLKDGQITAEWKVKAVKAGTFTEGVYDAEIRYNNSLPEKRRFLCALSPRSKAETFSDKR